jgi:hypothetical protein
MAASHPWSRAAEPAKTGYSSTGTPRSSEPAAPKKAGEGTIENQGGRIREGSKLVNQVGEFQKLTGDQVNFFAADGIGTLRVLENLALERVVRTMDDSDNSDRRTWSVSGVVTEFRGENYLLLTRAVFRAAQREESAVEARTPDLSDGKQ